MHYSILHKIKDLTLNYEEIENLINVLESDNTFLDRWDSFIKSNSYLGNLKFEEVIIEVKLLLDTLNDNQTT